MGEDGPLPATSQPTGLPSRWDAKAQPSVNPPLHQEHFDQAAPSPSDAAAVCPVTPAAISLIENGCQDSKLAEERHTDPAIADGIVYSALPGHNPTIPVSPEARPRPPSPLQPA